jgi:hypothetical protein
MQYKKFGLFEGTTWKQQKGTQLELHGVHRGVFSSQSPMSYTLPTKAT